jgi:hypothetical protein
MQEGAASDFIRTLHQQVFALGTKDDWTPGLFQERSGEATPTSAWSRRSATASPGLPPYRGVLRTAGTANQPGTGLASRAPGDDAGAAEKAAKPRRNRFPEATLTGPSNAWRPGWIATWSYPDFVCELTDGRALVVEYKGAHFVSGADAEAKGAVGAVWAGRSAGRCRFVMPSAGASADVVAAVRTTLARVP